jgi:hypothetical protein
MEACVSGVLLSIITPSGRVQRALTMEYITLVDPNRKDKVLRYLHCLKHVIGRGVPSGPDPTRNAVAAEGLDSGC